MALALLQKQHAGYWKLTNDITYIPQVDDNDLLFLMIKTNHFPVIRNFFYDKGLFVLTVQFPPDYIFSNQTTTFSRICTFSTM